MLIDSKVFSQLISKTLSKFLLVGSKIFGECPIDNDLEYISYCSSGDLKKIEKFLNNNVSKTLSESEVDIDKLIFFKVNSFQVTNIKKIIKKINQIEEDNIELFEEYFRYFVKSRINSSLNEIKKTIDIMENDEVLIVENLVNVTKKILSSNELNINDLENLVTCLDEVQGILFERLTEYQESESVDFEVEDKYGDLAFIFGFEWFDILTMLDIVYAFEKIITREIETEFKESYKNCAYISKISNDIIEKGDTDLSNFQILLDN